MITLSSLVKLIWKVVQNSLKLLLGTILPFVLAMFAILSCPVLAVRLLVIQMAKVLRPDLGDILNGQSVMYAVDYFARTPPRDNLVLTSIFQGQLTCEEIRERVMKRWINSKQDNGELTYMKFQQYPVRWMCFTFWKNVMESFCVENHVHKLFGRETPVTDNQLTEAIEKMLNCRHPDQKSSWEFYVIENYVYPHSHTNSKHSVLIFKYHHTLADGYGIMTALGDLFDKYSIRPKSVLPCPSSRKCITQNILHFANRVIITLNEISHFTSHILLSSSWKISDKNKAWHQLHVRAVPIPFQIVKDIKNKFVVSFTSVLLSAISSAMSKFEAEYTNSSEKKNTVELCASLVPVPDRLEKEMLTNEIAATVFSIPCKKFETSVDRLLALDEVMKAGKLSFLPHLSRQVITLFGVQFYAVSRLLYQNRWIPIGLSNFPGYPMTFEVNGTPLVDNSFVSGGLAGDTGLAIAVLSHGDNIRIGISTEKGIMTGQQAKKFFQYITNEIKRLDEMVNEK